MGKRGEYTRNFGACFAKTFNCGEFDYIDVYDKAQIKSTACRCISSIPQGIAYHQNFSFVYHHCESIFDTR